MALHINFSLMQPDYTVFKPKIFYLTNACQPFIYNRPAQIFPCEVFSLQCSAVSLFYGFCPLICPIPLWLADPAILLCPRPDVHYVVHTLQYRTGDRIRPFGPNLDFTMSGPWASAPALYSIFLVESIGTICVSKRGFRNPYRLATLSADKS